MACFETACVIAQVYLQELEKVRRNVLRVLPGGLGGISRVLTAKMMGKCQVIIDNKEYENKLEGVMSQYKQLQNSNLPGLCLFPLRMRSENQFCLW